MPNSRWIASTIASALLVLAAGCVSQWGGTFGATSFAHSNFPYQISKVDGRVMPEVWLLDNFFATRDGTVAPKQTPRYRNEYSVDVDGDDLPDAAISVARYDVRYVHRLTGASLFVRTFPVEQAIAEIDLGVLAHEYVDSLAGSELVTRYAPAVARGNEQRFAAQVLEESYATLDGAPAYVITYELANLDQVEVSPAARVERATIVFSRPGFSYAVLGSPVPLPVLLVAGYAARSEVYEREASAFTSLLSRLSIDTPAAAGPPGLIRTTGAPNTVLVTPAAPFSPVPTESLPPAPPPIETTPTAPQP